jgi:hypothetical protein
MSIERRRYNEPSTMGNASASSSVSDPNDLSGWADQQRRYEGKGKEREGEIVRETMTKEAGGITNGSLRISVMIMVCVSFFFLFTFQLRDGNWFIIHI